MLIKRFLFQAAATIVALTCTPGMVRADDGNSGNGK
jgi:hypothetical protein